MDCSHRSLESTHDMDGLAILESLGEPILEDLLPNVIKHLSQEDRGNWRLASKSMYEICTRSEIAKHEKFILDGMRFSSVQTMAQCILSCRRLRSTVELHYQDLTKLPVTVWTHLGRRITSLTISECNVDEITMYRIILHCPVLKHFYLMGGCKYQLFSSESLLDELIDAGVQRPQLRSLEFYQFGHLRESVYVKLLRIFPLVETFGRFLQLSNFYGDLIDHLVNNNGELIAHLVNNNGELIDHLVNFSLSHKRMKKVSLMVNDRAARIIPRLPCIIRNLSALKELVWQSTNVVFFTESEFVQFLETIGNLETLDFRSLGFRFTSADRQSWQLPSIKYNLSNLLLSFKAYVEDGNEVTLEILRRCRSLRVLSLKGHEIDGGILECIFRDHIGLRVLKANCGNCGEAAFTGQYRIDRLQDLETLDFCTSHIEAFAASLNCPKLTSCSFKVSWKEKCVAQKIEPLLNVLCERAPNLELLSMKNFIYNEHYLPPCMKRFYKLRYIIYCTSCEEVDGDHLLELFQSNPALQYVLFPRCDRGFTYDRLSRMVVSNSYNEPHCPFSFPYFHRRIKDINVARSEKRNLDRPNHIGEGKI